MNYGSLAGAAFLTIAIAGSVQAQQEGFEERRTEVRGVLLDGLRDHAEWLRGKKLFLERKVVLERILTFEPEDGESLRSLGWKKDRSGAWTPPKKPKRFKNYGKSGLEEVPVRYRTAVEPYVTQLRTFLAEDGLSPDQRQILIDDLFVVQPDDPELRAQRGETQTSGGWVLHETARSVAHRSTIEALATRSLEDAAWPEAVEPTAREAGITEWTKAYDTAAGRVLGTVDDEELLAMSRTLPGTLAFFRQTLDEEARYPDPLTIFLMKGDTDRDAFLTNHPTMYERDRKRLVNLSGTWVNDANDVAYWTRQREYRDDGIVRLLVGYLLGDSFRIRLQPHAWVHEGFGLYLTERLTGTRLTWFVKALGADGSDALRQRMLETADWNGMALEILAREDRPRLAELVVAPPQELTSEQLLYSYVVAGYLMEAFPGEVHEILGALGANRPAEAVLERALGRTLAETDRRILQWLEETRAVERGELVVDPVNASAEENE